MNTYFVVDTATGAKYGPADIATLNQWITERRVEPTTMLQDAATGTQLPAAQVPGLNFPQAAPSQPVIQQPTFQQPTQGPSAGPIAGPMNAPGRPIGGEVPYAGMPGNYGYSGDTGSKELTLSFVFAALSLLCCPLIFAVLGVIQANKAAAKGNKNAKVALILNIVAAVISIGYGVFYATQMMNATTQIPGAG